MSIKFNFNADEFRRKLEKATIESFKKQVQERVRHAPCPVHRRTATVTFSGTDLRSLRTDLRACCEQGLEAAKGTLPLKRSA
jgi:hypothetical protein